MGSILRWASGAQTDQVFFSLSALSNLLTCKTEWVIVELALNAYGKVGVSLYDTLGDEAVGAFVSRSLPDIPWS